MYNKCIFLFQNKRKGLRKEDTRESDPLLRLTPSYIFGEIVNSIKIIFLGQNLSFFT